VINPRRAHRLLLVRPDGYLGWVGTAAEFRTWSDTYFRDGANAWREPSGSP
jgi:hypothetical protein